MDDMTRDKESFDYARLLVMSSIPSITYCEVRVKVDDKIIPIFIQMETSPNHPQISRNYSGESGYTSPLQTECNGNDTGDSSLESQVAATPELAVVELPDDILVTKADEGEDDQTQFESDSL